MSNDDDLTVVYLWEKKEAEDEIKALLVAFAAREGIKTSDCSVYVTHMPCASCARTLIQAGVVEVVYGPGKTSMPEAEFEAAETMFAEASVILWERSEFADD